MRHFHEPAGSNDFDDPGGWNVASYTHHPCDDFEPIDLPPNGYRAISLDFLKVMLAVDEFVTAAPDARVAVVAVAVTLQWPSVRGLTAASIAEQLGTTPATITRACARFREMAGLADDGIQFIGNGAGSNGDKPAAVQA